MDRAFRQTELPRRLGGHSAARPGRRHPSGNDDLFRSGVTQYADTPMLRACPYFRTVLDAFACPLQAVRLMRLTSGSRINEHRDHDLSVEDGTVRIHIPVATNDGVAFMLNGTRVTMPPGSAWYLRLSDPHSVTNAGASDRVHLVIDAVANDWVRRMLEISAAAAAAASQSAG